MANTILQAGVFGCDEIGRRSHISGCQIVGADIFRTPDAQEVLDYFVGLYEFFQLSWP